MNEDARTELAALQRGFQVVGLSYFSLYIHDQDAAVSFYTRVFGPHQYFEDNPPTYGWKLGATWLTVFPSEGGPHPGSNPRGAEFAVQVAAPAEVDLLYSALIDAGAKPCMPPRDTTMYEKMRYSCVDDPFGARIDIYCPLAPAG